MTLRINKAHWPVTVLGYGRRIGIWLQGCSIHCPNCCSQDTWPLDEGRRMKVSDLLDWCKLTSGNEIDGVTISGGEPFEQAQGLLSLLKALRTWQHESARELDILCYSGFSWKHLKQNHEDILALLDVVIADPYIHTMESSPLRGSSNQTIQLLTQIGIKRYSKNELEHFSVKRIQVQVDEQRIWFIGIPYRDDMDKVDALCQKDGIVLKSVSWRG